MQCAAIRALVLFHAIAWYSVLAQVSRNRTCTLSPASCSCQYNVTDDVRLMVQCQRAELTYVPRIVDRDAVVLKLESNAITNIDTAAFVTAPYLHILRLDYNKIVSISNDAFLNLDRLMYLSLAGNLITGINETTFKHLSSLAGLSLSSNPIWYLRRNAFVFLPNLTSLFLVETDIVCACDQQLILRTVLVSGANLSQSSSCSTSKQQAVALVPRAESGQMEKTQSCQGTEVYGSDYCSLGNTNETSTFQPGVARCYGGNNTCLTVVSTRNWVKTRHDFCVSVETCRLLLMENPSRCFHNASDSECKLCCSTGSFCNADVYLWSDRNNASSKRSITNLWELTVSSWRGAADEQLLISRFRQEVDGLSVRPDSIALRAIDWRMSAASTTTVVIMATTNTSLYIGQTGLSLLYAQAIAAATNESAARISPLCLGHDHSTAACPLSVTKSESGSMAWPRTLVGLSATVPCPFSLGFKNISGAPSARRSCTCDPTGSITWDEPDETACRITPENALNLTTHLTKLLEESSLDASDKRLENAVEILVDSIVTMPRITRDVSTMIVNSLSKLYSAADVTRMVAAEQDRSSATSIINGLAALASNIRIDDNETVVIQADNVAVAAKRIHADDFQGMDFSLPQSEHATDLNSSKSKLQELAVHVVLKPSLLSQAKVLNGNSSTDRAYFVIQKKDTMFAAVQRSKAAAFLSNHSDSGIALLNATSAPLTASYIIDIGLPGLDVENLSDPVEIHLQSFNSLSSSLVCAYWDEKMQAWSQKGVYRVGGQGNITICHSTHLTNFALLMSVDQGQVSEPVQTALSYMSMIGCSISLASVLITLAITLTRRGLSHDNPGKILINLCVALAFTNLIFLSLTHFTDGIICQVCAALLHFFVLAAFMWMLIEAFYMYLSFIVVFGAHYSYFMLKAVAAGWGVPLVIVVVTASVNTDNYGLSVPRGGSSDTAQSGICWLTGYALYGAFHAPVGLILLANGLVFAMVLRRLLATRQNLREDKEKRMNVAKQLRAAASLVALLGLTWLIGFFAVGDARATFSVLFVVFNSLQGFFIFIFYCAMRPDVQRVWRPRLCPCLPPLPDKSFATSSMSTSAAASGSTRSNSRRDSRKDSGYLQTSAPETMPTKGGGPAAGNRSSATTATRSSLSPPAVAAAAKPLETYFTSV